MTTVAHVFAGGDPVSAERILGLQAADLTVAANSGAETAAAAGLTVDVLVGDLDSITEETLNALVEDGTRIESHLPDKDATDLELALGAAVRLGADEIVVIGGGGGRLDHLLGNVAAITSRALREVPVCWVREKETVFVVHHRTTVPVAQGATFSLIPIGGSASGVTVTGAKWNLHNATLESGSSLGISNLALAAEIEVEVGRGILLVICLTAGRSAS